MPNTGNNASDGFDSDLIELSSDGGEPSMGNDPGQYYEVYKEMAEMIGDANVRKIWRRYSGLTITFPQHLYSREYTRQFITENYQTMKPKEIAKAVGLSERRVRQIIREIRLEENSAAPDCE